MTLYDVIGFRNYGLGVRAIYSLARGDRLGSEHGPKGVEGQHFGVLARSEGSRLVPPRHLQPRPAERQRPRRVLGPRHERHHRGVESRGSGVGV